MPNTNLTEALEQVWKSERQLGDAYFLIADRAEDVYELQRRCTLFGHWSFGHAINLDEFMVKHNCVPLARPAAAHAAPVPRRVEGTNLRHDLEELLPLAEQTRSAWTALAEAAKASSDAELSSVIARCAAEIDRQINWLNSQLKRSTPKGSITSTSLMRRSDPGEQSSQSS